MDIALHKTTSDNFHFFNTRLEKLNQENLELKDSADRLLRENSDLRQHVAKLQQDLDHYKSRYSQSQIAVSNKTLEINNLKSLKSMGSFAVLPSRAMSIELRSPDETPDLLKQDKNTGSIVPEMVSGEDITKSFKFSVPELKKRSTSLGPLMSNPVNQLSKIVSPQSSNQAATISEGDNINQKMTDNNRLIAEMFRQEVKCNANLKCTIILSSKARACIPGEIIGRNSKATESHKIATG